MKDLAEILEKYAASDIYPFHMPGHKRRALPFPNPYTIDITEIDGFDNLHRATGILKEAQDRLAALYGVKRSFFLVNGSTCGILAAVHAATRRGESVLAARNCHKSVYHALCLNGLHAEYLYPPNTSWGFPGQITADEVEQALTKNPNHAAVILTSPTYEGIASDISAIAKVTHSFGIPLIVDGAHGAHFGFGGGFPEHAGQLGADAVIMSLHKTLPSFTQTAVLHLSGNLISEEKIKWFLSMFETSSPSYLFMAGMDVCVRMLCEDSVRLFADYRERLDKFYQKTADLAGLHVITRTDFSPRECFAFDDGKIIISSGNMSGSRLYGLLLKDHHLQLEMASFRYALAMTSIMDTSEGFLRLCDALHDIDRLFQNETMTNTPKAGIMYDKMTAEMTMADAVNADWCPVPFSAAAGRISADTVCIYPPGIPILVPGEVITKEVLNTITESSGAGLLVEGSPYF